MMQLRFAGLAGAVAVWLAVTWPAGAQEALTTQATTRPAAALTEPVPIMTRVLEARGDVKHAPLDSADWQPCQVDDEYPPQTVILTGVRSSIKLQIGADDTYTAVVIESVSKVVISEALRTADTKRVRIGVGYGRMRAGVAEGGLKSDFTVDSPVATLSKRGTWDFGLFYERGSDRFEMFLLDQGLVEAFDKITGGRRIVLPRELVTETMRRWGDQAQLLRNVAVVDIPGQGDIEVAFNRLQQSGLRVLDPEGGQVVLIDLSSSFSQQQFATLARDALPTTLLPPRPGALTLPEGYFGTGRGDQLIPVLIKDDSSLAQRGLAQPGTYKFRRSALEGWLRKHGSSR